MDAEPSCFNFSEVSIDSSIELPELPRASSPSEIIFRFDESPAPTVDERDRVHDWLTPDGDKTLSCFRIGSGYHLNTPAWTDFTISSDGTSIRGFASGDADLEAVRHDLLAQVLPRVLSHRGGLVLHASAVDTQHGVVAFLGDTGAGKSTLAASFSAHGFPVISDDCLVLGLGDEGPRAVPTLRGPRLWPDSAAELIDPEDLLTLPSEPSGKVSLPGYSATEKDHPSALQLTATFVLHPKPPRSGFESPVLEEMSPAEALMSLVEHSFQLDITHRPSQEQRLELFSHIVRDVPTYRLEYEQEYSCLDKVKQHVLQHLAESA